VRRAIRRGPRGRRLGTRTEGGPGPRGHEATANGARHQVRTEVRHTAHVTVTDTDTDTATATDTDTDTDTDTYTDTDTDTDTDT
jgi:hypothetical protein